MDIIEPSAILRDTGRAHKWGATVPFAAAITEVRLAIPDGDVPNPELTILIPTMNERLTIATFIEWCREGMRKAGMRRDPDRRQLHRRNTRDRAVTGRPRPADPQTRPGTRLHRCHSLYPRQVRAHGRCRLHLRLPRDRRVRARSSAPGTSSSWARVSKRLHRTALHAGAAPLFRYARHYRHSELPLPARTSPTSIAACAA